jgi:D-alanine-D-alanine ligase
VPATLEATQLKALERAARECFIALGCRDVARVDFRMDEQGKIYFLECNPLPGLTPGWSDLVLIAKAAGIEYNPLISEILSGAIRRYKERERERRTEARGPDASKPHNGVNGTQSVPPPPPPEEPRIATAVLPGT